MFTKNLKYIIMKQIITNNKIRFTTLINKDLLSQIKLISYFTNQKLNETINESLKIYIKDFESKNNTTLNSIIDLQNNFTPLNNPIETPSNTEIEDNKSISKK